MSFEPLLAYAIILGLVGLIFATMVVPNRGGGIVGRYRLFSREGSPIRHDDGVWVDCPDCKATGKIAGKTCRRCDGNGQIRKS